MEAKKKADTLNIIRAAAGLCLLPFGIDMYFLPGSFILFSFDQGYTLNISYLMFICIFIVSPKGLFRRKILLSGQINMKKEDILFFQASSLLTAFAFAILLSSILYGGLPASVIEDWISEKILQLFVFFGS